WLHLWSCAVVTGSVAAPADAWAQAPVPAEGTVTQVRVEGTRRVDEAVVLAAIGLRAGEQLTPEKVRRDLAAVYATGFFEDVRFELVPDGGGVALIVIVDEKPAIREVQLTGASRVSEEDVREVIDVRAFSVLNQAALDDSVEAIRELYVEKGYYLADIEAQIIPVNDDQVDVRFTIVEGRKVLVQSIEFTGNEHIPDSRIKRFLGIREAGFLPFLTSAGTFQRD